MMASCATICCAPREDFWWYSARCRPSRPRMRWEAHASMSTLRNTRRSDRNDGVVRDDLLRAAGGLLVVLRQVPAFQAEDALGGPRVNVHLAEHQAFAVPLDGHVLVFDQPFEVTAA